MVLLHCAPVFNFFVDPGIFPWEQIYTKNYHFSWLLELQAHIFYATKVKFGMRVRTWDSLLHAKFGKNRLREYTPFGQIYTPKKLQILVILGAVDPHF